MFLQILHPLLVGTAKTKAHCHSISSTKYRKPVITRTKPMELSHLLQADKAAQAPNTTEPTLPKSSRPEEVVVVVTHTATASAASHHHTTCPLQHLQLLMSLHQPHLITAKHTKANNKHITNSRGSDDKLYSL